MGKVHSKNHDIVHTRAGDAIIAATSRLAAEGFTIRQCGIDGDVLAISYVKVCGHPNSKASRDTNHAVINAGNTVRDNKPVAKAMGRSGPTAIQEAARLHIKKAKGDADAVSYRR